MRPLAPAPPSRPWDRYVADASKLFFNFCSYIVLFFSFGNQGKGAVGWKAPPKPVRDTAVRQPTQGQSDAAKRLSQGLSVTRDQSARGRYTSQNMLGVPNPLASSGYSVVLDPTEYSQMGANAPSPTQQGIPTNGAYPTGAYANVPQQAGAAPGNPYTPVYGGIYPAFNRDGKPEAVWPSTKANRCTLFLK